MQGVALYREFCKSGFSSDQDFLVTQVEEELALLLLWPRACAWVEQYKRGIVSMACRARRLSRLMQAGKAGSMVEARPHLELWIADKLWWSCYLENR